VLWTYYRATERTALETAAAAYNATLGLRAPHVIVRTFPFEGFGDRIARTVPRGTGPDLFIYPQDRLGGWVAAGNTVEPIDRFMGPSVQDRFIPATMQAMTYGGATYGLPLAFKTITLIYNKKLVGTPPKTTAELAAIAKKLTNRGTGTYGVVYEYSNYYYHAALQNGFGGRVFGPRLEPTIDSPENLRAMELLLKWKADFLPEESPTKTQVITLFNEGKAAMIFSGSWVLPDISKSIDYGLAELPTVTEAYNHPMQPWLTVEGMYIAAPSQQKDAAYDFLKYVTDLRAAKALALESGFMPANQRAYIDPELAGDEKLGAFFKQARLAVPMPNVPEMTVMWSPVFMAMNNILSGTVSVDAALARAQEQVASGAAMLHSPQPPQQQAVAQGSHAR
jgi:arabinogalactan oligomer/maltooligosaccharide transport system substrate-binding protein